MSARPTPTRRFVATALAGATSARAVAKAASEMSVVLRPNRRTMALGHANPLHTTATRMLKSIARRVGATKARSAGSRSRVRVRLARSFQIVRGAWLCAGGTRGGRLEPGLRVAAGTLRHLFERRGKELGLLGAQRAEVAFDLCGVDRAHLLQHPLSGGRQLGLEASPVLRAGYALQIAGFLEAVNELGDPAAAQRQPFGELAHSGPAVGAAIDRPQQLEPAQRRQVGGGG